MFLSLVYIASLVKGSGSNQGKCALLFDNLKNTQSQIVAYEQ